MFAVVFTFQSFLVPLRRYVDLFIIFNSVCFGLLALMFAQFVNLSVSFQLLDMLKFYTGFEINDQTGNALTENEMTTIHYDRITSLQVSEMHYSLCICSMKLCHK